MTDQKPTGVFVPLHEGELTDCQKRHFEQGKYGEHPNSVRTGGITGGLLAIGTPVTGGDLEVVGWGLYSASSSNLTIFTNSGRAVKWANHFGRTLYPVVRQSEAQAQIAARDAEIVRLQEALVAARDAITSDLNAKSIVCTVWAGPAETLVDYIDAALKGGAA